MSAAAEPDRAAEQAALAALAARVAALEVAVGELLYGAHAAAGPHKLAAQGRYECAVLLNDHLERRATADAARIARETEGNRP
ncbi:hypothetical protein NBH00_12765 [Paraconexibacter antarcticus]|uniref:HNH endonuclease n=1 Tax=Paraconexibacter antarcticus TaxID=2949664 RepID=A0ABY5DKK9_9ACTN|nr:hypothetical protein [Paraconexibacter antarcticus]UTI62240.1 hypothetical protein NBH00_12765 [Paraconexibacter antarcticus]